MLRGLISRRNAQDGGDEPIAFMVLELAATALGGIDVGGYPILKSGELAPFTLPAFSDLPTDDIDSALGGMVPDVLGEMWILDELGSVGVRASSCRAALDVAWKYSPARYAAFVDRAARDHPFHEQLLALLDVECEGDPETWFEMVWSVIPHLRDPRSPRVVRVLELLRARPADDRRESALAEAGFAIANLWLAMGAHETACKLYTVLIETVPAFSLNPPTGLWDRRLGPGGRWAGACVRAGAFWGVRDWGAGLVRVGGAWGSAALRGVLWAAQMSWGRLRMCPRARV